MKIKCDKCKEEIKYKYRAKQNYGIGIINDAREKIGTYYEAWDLFLCEKCINEMENERRNING